MSLRTRRLGFLVACAGAVGWVASCGQADSAAPSSADGAVGSSSGSGSSTPPVPPSALPEGGVSTPPDAGPVLRLVSPSAAETPWARESEHAVLWGDVPTQKYARNPFSSARSVTISYSLDEGATWTSVPRHDRETGRLMVDEVARRARITVPATGGTTIRVRVTAGRHQVDSRSIPLIPSQKRKYSFVRVTEQLPIRPRDGACGLVHDGAMWLLGGWNPDNPLAYPAITANDVWRSTDASTWQLIKPNTFYDPATFDSSSDWSGRHTMGCVTHAGKMFIVGGDGVHTPTRDVWSSTDGVAWTRVSANTNYPARVLQPVFSFQDKLWVVSGQTFFSEFTLAYPDVWSSQNGATWTRVPTEGPLWAPRGMIFGPAVFKGRMWLVSGGLYDEPSRPERVQYDDVWSSADGVNWRRDLEHTPFIPRHMLNVDVFDDRLWVLGGASNEQVLGQTSNLRDVFYTADGSNWYELVTPPGYIGRHAASTWQFRDALYLGLGNTENEDLPSLGDSEDAGADDGGAAEAGLADSEVDAGPVVPVDRWIADMWKISVEP
ncbi:MAG: hypothetical protein IPQ09_14540 [Myxococcales bacterium]|nr:hypothetical protein [Myxococcales bacterium]HQY59879.1 hypothetical protein [Polyangiaceae bacterium]